MVKASICEKFFKFLELKPIWRAQKIIRHDPPPLVLEGTPGPKGGVVRVATYVSQLLKMAMT